MSKRFFVTLTIFLFLLSCKKDNIISEAITSTFEKSTILKTASFDDLTKLQDSILLLSKSQKNANKFEYKINIDLARLEGITGSSANMLVAPIETNFEGIRSELVILNINGKIQSSFVHRIYKKINDYTKIYNYDGYMIITELNGHILKRYKVTGGVIVSELIIKNIGSKASKLGECDEELDPTSIFCDNELEEVVVIAPRQPGSTYIPLVFPENSIDENITWESDGSGGINNNSSFRGELLCGEYKFKRIGDSYVINITGLGAQYANLPSSYYTTIFYPELCLTIPSKNVEDSYHASWVFIGAWHLAVNQTVDWLTLSRELGIRLTDFQAEQSFRGFLITNLNFLAITKGAAVGRTTCYGANTQPAEWCGGK